MSWQLASFFVLAMVLVGGFAWYERSRPPSQVVALVAALAALAIAGRVAFAALPNVKPTTDIAIFAGCALGPAPGFAVGALAALVSNFWFGQGPWTPWQMAGWGLCGAVGAALGLRGRQPGRLTLALACALAGAAYGALLNFSLMATYGGELSMQRFLTLEARAVPFDAAHAIGNLALALVAGPAMVRMLARFRRRFEWREAGSGRDALPSPGAARRGGPRLRGGVAAAIVAALALAALPASPARAADVSRATRWLESVQNADGGFGASPGDESSAEMTGWAMLALEAAGRNPLDVSRRGHTPVDYLRGEAERLGSSGDLARTILALEGAGVDPRSFAGRNLIAMLLDRRRDDGSFRGWPTTTAYSAIALRAAGATGGLDRTLAWLARAQNADGGWGDLPGPPSNPDSTGAAMQAMPETQAARRGLAYLRRAQRPGGGFPLGGRGPVNSQSTAWAVQGMIAAGADPGSFRRGGASPLDYLAKRQADDGHYRYSSSSDQTPVWVTAQVLVAVAGKSLPLAPPPRAPKPEPRKDAEQPGGAGAPDGSRANAEKNGHAPVAPPAGASGGRLPGSATPPGPGSDGPPGLPSPGPESEGPASPSAPPPATATEAGESSSPWPPIGIGLASGGLALGATLWLGRRRGW